MAGILYLFPDTNLLIQCSPLEQLNWEQWKAFEEVHLLITRPVQREIDKHKNGGNDRLGRRGKKAASLLREVITGDADHNIIREAGPCVKLFVRIDLRPNDTLTETLNFGEPDDQLVGTAHSFMSANPSCDVRILTHDTGPMASARVVKVAVEVIPDEWLLPPEASEADKRIKALEGEVARLTQAEPTFDITCLDRDGKPCELLALEATIYDALSEAEVA